MHRKTLGVIHLAERAFADNRTEPNMAAAATTYNVAAFVSTLFLLEFGADKFVDHTAIVAQRTRIPDTIIALLTAGAEWEEVGSRSFNLRYSTSLS